MFEWYGARSKARATGLGENTKNYFIFPKLFKNYEQISFKILSRCTRCTLYCQLRLIS